MTINALIAWTESAIRLKSA